jgi:hypothetical protein
MRILYRFTVISVVLFQFACSNNNPQGVLTQYLSAKTYQDRLKYVVKPDVIKSRFLDHYHKMDPNTPELLGFKIIKVEQKADNAALVTVDVNHDRAQFLMKRIDGRWLVDWELSVDWAPIPPKVYLATRPFEPTAFRLWASLATYYNYEYLGGQSNYLSIELRGQKSVDSRNETMPYGFIERSSKDGKALYNLLSDGKPHFVVLRISFNPNGRAGSNVVSIDKFIGTDPYFALIDPSSPITSEANAVSGCKSRMQEELKGCSSFLYGCACKVLRDDGKLEAFCKELVNEPRHLCLHGAQTEKEFLSCMRVGFASRGRQALMGVETDCKKDLEK